MKAFIVYPTYTNIEDQTYIQLFGRLENNQSFVCSITYRPYFFIEKTDLSKIKTLLKRFKVKSSNTELTNFHEKSVVKISFANQTDLNNLRKKIHEKKIDTYEGDLKPHMKFIIDNNGI